MTNETKRILTDWDIQRLEIQENIRGDGLDFWAERNGWPISAKDKIYLLEAIDAEGERLFGSQWTGIEQAEQFYPILFENADVSAGGLDEVYAINLLGTYRPELGRSPVIETRDEVYRNPLSDEEWRIAFSIFHDVVAPERVAGNRRRRAVVKSIHTRLVNGDLQAWSRSIRGVGGYQPISSESWTVDTVMGRFLFGMFDPHQPLQDMTLKIAPHLIKTSQLPEALWPEFIFLDANQILHTSGLNDAKDGAGGVKMKTRQDVENSEAEAEKIYHSMLNDLGRVKRRDFEQHCKRIGIKSTTSRRVFSQLNEARPGQRD